MSPVSSDASEAVYSRLFPRSEGGIFNYAVLDGASVPGLVERIWHAPRKEAICLYRGELEPDIAEVAPYLVHLVPGSPLTDWVLKECWGNHWGVFVRSKADLTLVRRHFRQFLMVKDPQGKPLYFRFYDPRVLRVFLPVCNASELAFLFGPLNSYICEAQEPSQAIVYGMEDGKLATKLVPLGPGGE